MIRQRGIKIINIMWTFCKIKNGVMIHFNVLREKLIIFLLYRLFTLIACHIEKCRDPCTKYANVDALQPSFKRFKHVEVEIVEVVVLGSASNN
jgi:hypothetical protein